MGEITRQRARFAVGRHRRRKPRVRRQAVVLVWAARVAGRIVGCVCRLAKRLRGRRVQLAAPTCGRFVSQQVEAVARAAWIETLGVTTVILSLRPQSAKLEGLAAFGLIVRRRDAVGRRSITLTLAGAELVRTFVARRN